MLSTVTTCDLDISKALDKNRLNRGSNHILS